jgi:hypothetical protein
MMGSDEWLTQTSIGAAMNVLNKLDPGLDQTHLRLTPPILFIRVNPGHPWLKTASPLAAFQLRDLGLEPV